MSIELKAGHNAGPVTVEICHSLDGSKAVMFEQDNFDVVSMSFDEIDKLIEYLTEQKEKFK